MSKPGIHIQLNVRDPNYDQRIRDLQPASFTIVCDRSMWWYVDDLLVKCPRTRIVLRDVQGEDERKGQIGSSDPFDKANRFASHVFDLLTWIRKTHGEAAWKRAVHRVYFAPFDEWGGDEKDTDIVRKLEWVRDHDLAAIAAFAELDIKYMAINLAEGNPPHPPFNHLDGWAILRPVLEAINIVGPHVAVVGLHAYGVGIGMFDQADAHLLRLKFLEQRLDEWHLPNVYIAINEDGKDLPSFFDSFGFYTPLEFLGVGRRPDSLSGYTAYANDWVTFDKVLCERAHWRVLWHNWYTLDMLDAGYEVKDHVSQKGNKVTGVYPIFSIAEKYVRENPPFYVLDNLGPIEIPPTDPPPATKPEPGTYFTTTELNVRTVPRVSNNAPYTFHLKDQPMVITEVVTGEAYEGNSFWGKIVNSDGVFYVTFARLRKG